MYIHIYLCNVCVYVFSGKRDLQHSLGLFGVNFLLLLPLHVQFFLKKKQKRQTEGNVKKSCQQTSKRVVNNTLDKQHVTKRYTKTTRHKETYKIL